MSSQKTFRFVLCGSFFLAGFCAIALEILWARDFQRYTGTALPTVALVAAVFMTGLLVGSCIASQFANKFGQPLRVYAFSQALLAGAGLSFILFRQQLYAHLEIIASANVQNIALAECLRLSVIAVVLVVPTVLIGVGFPLIVQALRRIDSNDTSQEESAQRDAALVYFANVLGSATGALVCGFYFLPQFGITVSIAIISSLSLCSAIAAYIAHRSRQANMLGAAREYAKAVETVTYEDASLSDLDAGVVVLMSGFVTMLLEMLWTRFGMLIFGSSSYALRLILLCQLAGLSIGAFSVAFARGKTIQPALFIKVAALTAGLCVLLSAYLFSIVPQVFLQISFALAAVKFLGAAFAFIVSRLLVAVVLLVPASSALGLIFPLAVKSTPDGSGRIPWLYVLNTFGAVQGCIVGGILILPVLGRLTLTPLMLAFVMTGAFLVVFAALFKPNGSVRSQRILAVMATVLCVILLAVPPRWSKAVMSSGPAFLTALPDSGENDKASALRQVGPEQEKNLLFYQEGVNAITSVMQNYADNLRLLRTDGKIEAALPSDKSKPFVGSDQSTHILLGELPLLLCPHKASDVLLIGLGSGVTADAILDHEAVSNLVVTELEKSVRAAGVCFTSNRRNDGSARMKIVDNDGRNYLSLLKQKYDVIVSQPGEPFLPGMANLYTWEFWQLSRTRLTDGGVFCQWVQLYAVNEESIKKICRTFHAVFPNTLIFRSTDAGEILLVGFNIPQPSGQALAAKRLFNYIQPNTPDAQSIKGFFPFSSGLWIDFNEFCRRFAQPKVRERLTYIGIEEPLELITTLRVGPADLIQLVDQDAEDTQVIKDDTSTLEWSLPLELNRQAGVLPIKNLEMFSGVPSDIDQLFFNIGTTKTDTADFIIECATRYALRTGQERANGQTVIDYDRCTNLANDAHRFTYCAATLAGKALVMKYFGHRLPPSFRSLYGVSVGSLTNAEDCRMVGLFAEAVGSGDALASFQKATAITPNSAQAWLDLGSYLWSKAQVKEAGAAFESMTRVDPYSARAKEGAGIALIAQGQTSRGLALIKQALTMNPSLPKARLVLGRQLLADGHEKEGLYQLYWDGRINPETADANLAVTAYFVFAKKWQLADENLTILRRQLPGDRRVRYLEQIVNAKQSIDRMDPKLRSLLDPVSIEGQAAFGTNQLPNQSK